MATDAILKPPSWAAFLRPVDFLSFAEIVHAELARRGLTTTFEEPDVAVQVEGRTVSFSLAAIAQRCRSKPVGQWRQIVGESLAGLDQKRAHVPDALAAFETFDSCRENLKLRVRSDAFLSTANQYGLLARPLAPGLCEQLVVDLGKVRVALPVPVLESWKLPASQVWETALHNVRTRVKVGRMPSIIPAWQVDALEGGPYTSAQVRCLERHLPKERPFGALVAVPSTDMVLLHVLKTASSFLTSLDFLERAAGDFFRDAEEGVSTQLYWWCDGALEPIGLQRVGGRLEMRPGEAFERVLVKLP